MLRSLALLTLVGSGLTACAGPSGDNGGPSGSGEEPVELAVSTVARAQPDPATLAGAADSVRAFTADLYRRQAGADATGNLVSSPYSVAVALAMTRNGAAGATAREMDAVLHAPAGGLTRYDAGLNTLQRTLESRAGRRRRADGSAATITLDVANSLWGQVGFTWRGPFLDALARYYGTGMRQVDYVRAAEPARAKINTWTSGQTHGKIPDLIPSGVLDEYTRLVLVNAIYLKAPWETPFVKGATAPAPFTRLDGSTIDVPMMTADSDATLGYASGPGWRAVDLPYAGGQLAMGVIVPDQGRFAEVERALDAAALRGALTRFRPTSVQLRLPRWTVRSTASLREILSALGMPTAFSDGADLSAMSVADRLKISAVLHQAFVAVDEQGTEAAAATAAVVRALAAPQPAVTLTVDRPFVFVVHDVATATPLFVGRVADPSARV